MAGKRASNDAGDSDDTGEPKPSAGRRLQDVVRPRTATPPPVGFDDRWKVETRDVTGSRFEPDEFEALPPFLRSRDPVTVPDTQPARRSSFLAPFLRLAPLSKARQTPRAHLRHRASRLWRRRLLYRRQGPTPAAQFEASRIARFDSGWPRRSVARPRNSVMK